MRTTDYCHQYALRLTTQVLQLQRVSVQFSGTLETYYFRCRFSGRFCAGRKFDLRERFAEADLEGGPLYATSTDVPGVHIHPKN